MHSKLKWLAIGALSLSTWASDARADTHLFSASICEAAEGTSDYEFGGSGFLEYSHPSAVGTFTCAFDNHTASGSSTGGFGVYVRDYSDESGNDGNVGCQTYSTTAFTGNLSWGSFEYTSATGTQTLMLTTTVYGTGLIGLFCRVPHYDSTGGGLGASRIIRLLGTW